MTQRLKQISGGVEKTASMIVLILVFAFILYLAVSSLFETSFLSTDDPSGERIVYLNDNVFLSIIIFTILLLTGYIFYRDRRKPWQRRGLGSRKTGTESGSAYA